MNGVILLNKEKDMTSRDCVNKACKYLKTKKIGHTGTLDPLATGVLILCVGNATKIVDIITSKEKEYIATFQIGILTDTLDNTGNIIKETDIKLTKEEIEKAIISFKKTYDQQVPIYSAVKVNGKKLYEYARNNEEVKLPSRIVTIHNIEILNIDLSSNTVMIKTTVSKGTYIRSLINDICVSLNTFGIMTDLKRTKQGNISIEQCCTLEDIKNNEFKIYEIDQFVNGYKELVVDEELESKILNGQILDKPDLLEEEILFRNKEKEILAIYKIYEKDNTKIKPHKMFKNRKI